VERRLLQLSCSTFPTSCIFMSFWVFPVSIEEHHGVEEFNGLFYLLQ
jgi:hypothetical protein